MGSKLGIILSLFFAIFVFIFSADLITLQANYSNLETIANTVGEMFSKEGGAAFRKINEYLKHQKGVELILENTTFKYGEFKEVTEDTNIFIYPPYQFKAVDALITNFHLPKSTLLMLVSALAGKENIMSAYKIATESSYRFFSFGDAMFIK